MKVQEFFVLVFLAVFMIVSTNALAADEMVKDEIL